MNGWLKTALIAVGLLAFAAAVWIGAPMIGWNGWHPFEPAWPRLLLIALVWLPVLGWYGFRLWRRRRAEGALEEALKENDDPGDGEVLAARMGEALDTLKRSSGRRSYLYELPWYVIIGPPGAGKTTALVNSGLKFPLAGADGGRAVAGVGGTRYCDWWFTEDAVLVDTAGRYTTQDSDAGTDRKSWLAFLSLLKENRPKQPINGVILAISLEDLMTLPAEGIAAHADAIRTRLAELNQELKIDFPVYALFTKADLVQGFREYFGSFTESRRRKVWGATFQTEDRRKNLVAEVPGEFDALVRRLTEELPDRLHEEPDPIARIAIFDFPAQFAALRDRVAEFLNRVFEPTRYRTSANLRGFYFSSGTQEGTPIDQVLGAISRGMGRAAGAHHLSGTGRSFFLHDLLKSVVFAESGWVSYDRRAVRLANAGRYGTLAAITLATLAVLGAWSWSYFRNKALITSTENAVAEYRVLADAELKKTTISDTDFDTVLDYLHKLRYMPVGYAHRDEPTPLGETFGLSQRARLVSAADTSYRQALERMLRSRLILRLEKQIEQNINDPIVVYEALKVYLMLGGKAPKVDDDLIEAWMQKDWQELYPGAANAAGRQEMMQHLKAMLDLGRAHKPTFELNGPLIESAQRSLARMKMADRAYALIKSSAYSANLEDYSVVSQGGADTALVFETVDGSDINDLKVPGLFSYAGFNGFFLNQLSAVAQKLIDEQWVMGDLGKQAAVEEQFAHLGPELLDLYRADFIQAWEKMLDNLKFRPMSADKPQYLTLAAASAPTSPIKLLFQSLAQETKLTAEPAASDSGAEDALAAAAKKKAGKALGSNATLAGDVAQVAVQRTKDRLGGLARIGIDLALKKSQRRAGEAGGDTAGPVVPGANIEAYFKPYQMLVEGDPGKRPIDALVQNFYDVYQNLVLAAANPSQAQQANQNLQLDVVNLRANASRLPKPLARMVSDAVDDFESDAAGSSIAQLNQMMAGTVTRVCREVVQNRYPFDRRAARDVPMADFARLFAPNGIMDQFFAQNLASMADISGKIWTWKQDTRVGKELSKDALRQFQYASEIREAFFPGGGSAPGVQLTVTPLTLSGDAQMALLNVNGTVLQTQQVGNAPVTLTWPSSGGSGDASISLQPEIPGRDAALQKSGPWALLRLIDAASVSRKGDDLMARFVIGGREVSYKIQVGSVANPFFLPALGAFHCPTGL